jgi:hypothetical protein
MAHSRPSEKFLVFAACTTLGWQVVRRLTFAKGEAMANAGVYARVYDEVTGLQIGYQIAKEPATDKDIPSQPTQAVISISELEANAGVRGRSRTAGLPEHKRLERAKRTSRKTGKLLLPEDAIERATAKVRVYPMVGPARGDILRAWPKK